MQLTYSFLKKIAPFGNDNYLQTFVNVFNSNAAAFKINTPERVLMFIVQLAHESDGFKTTKEYASGKAYEGRKDLGNTFKGDGVKFKGRGFIQTTGRANYKDTSKGLFGDDRLVINPKLLENPINATLSAMYFWTKKGLNEIADKPNEWKVKTKIGNLNKFQYITYRINGGQNGLPSRLAYLSKAKKYLTANDSGVTGIVLSVALIALIYFAI